jgi:hypothetical protein
MAAHHRLARLAVVSLTCGSARFFTPAPGEADSTAGVTVDTPAAPAYSADAPGSDVVHNGSTYFAFSTGTRLASYTQVLCNSSGSPANGWVPCPGFPFGTSALPSPPAWHQFATQNALGVFAWGGDSTCSTPWPRRANRRTPGPTACRSPPAPTSPLLLIAGATGWWRQTAGCSRSGTPLSWGPRTSRHKTSRWSPSPLILPPADTGWWPRMAEFSPTTHRSPERPERSPSTARSTGWPPPQRPAATGSSGPTAGCSPTECRSSVRLTLISDEVTGRARRRRPRIPRPASTQRAARRGGRGKL